MGLRLLPGKEAGQGSEKVVGGGCKGLGHQGRRGRNNAWANSRARATRALHRLAPDKAGAKAGVTTMGLTFHSRGCPQGAWARVRWGAAVDLW